MYFAKRLFRQLMATYGVFSRQQGPLLAAAIAYYLAFSLFPMMLVLVAGLGWAFRFTASGQNVQQHILDVVAEQASPGLSEQLALALGSVERNAAASGVVGAVVLVATAMAIFTQIDYAFDRLWNRDADESIGWRERAKQLIFVRLKALVMLMAVGAFVIIVMISSLIWRGIEENAASLTTLSPWIERLAQPVVHLLLNLLAFTVMYLYLPKASVRWAAALRGSILASILWEAGRQVLAAYVVGNKLPSAYGLIGSFMAVMLWTYYAMLVVLFGAAFTRVVNEENDLTTK
jgi:membrane protein